MRFTPEDTVATDAGRPLISVVMPAWKRPEKVQRAVQSVMQQEFSHWELIIVDDASPEPMEAPLREAGVLDDPRVRLLRHSINGGGSAARNTGIQHATAPWVALLDADDLWLPGKLTSDADFARLHEGERCFGFGQFWVDTGTARRTSVPAQREQVEQLDEFMFVDRGAMQTSSLLVPTWLARECPFDPTLRRLQDWDFVLRLWRSGAIPIPIACRQTIYDAPDDAARISSNLDPEFLLRWLHQRRDWFTPRARAGYLANKVAPELVQTGQRARAASLLARGAAAGVVAPRSLAIELLRLCVPASAFRGAVQLKHRIRRRG
jgi:hypothetical protein